VMDERDVISHITISLLEALEGCSKSITTIDGEKSIDIPKNIKNKEEVKISNLGVARHGAHRVIVKVEYPAETTKLIEALKGDM